MTEQMREIIEIQLDLFDYYSHKVVNSSLKKLHEQLQAMKSVSFQNTIYSVLPQKSGCVNSGIYYLLEYKEINAISKHVVYSSFPDAAKNLPFVENIVFVDDICGSGKTFISFVDKNKELLIGKNVCSVVL